MWPARVEAPSEFDLRATAVGEEMTLSETEPTVIVGFPVIFFVQPARFQVASRHPRVPPTGA